MSANPIQYWDRHAGAVASELVYGEGAVRWLYESAMGKIMGQPLLTGAFVSRLYGALQSTRWSARKIDDFVRAYSIRMEEYEDAHYRSFNDFFIRKFRPGARTFAPGARDFPAFCEARYHAFASVPESGVLPVKGLQLTPAALLGDARSAAPFVNGPAFIARLCPVDYHRYHYPDAGQTDRSYRLPGGLHSVNPIALRARGQILIENERHISMIRTDAFGLIAYVEIGATMVGRIVQSHDEKKPHHRGDEKGYFLFGGSCVVVLGERGKWMPDQDLLDRSSQGMETLIRLGEKIAAAPAAH